MGLNAVLGVYILTYICANTQGNEICYLAKTCIHDDQEKCGEDKDGNVRRFLDSCDMKEYNCLKKTDFKKTSIKDCESLPPLEETLQKVTNSSKNEKYNNSKAEVDSEEGSKAQEELVDSIQENVLQNEESQENIDSVQNKNEESEDNPQHQVEQKPADNETSISRESEANINNITILINTNQAQANGTGGSSDK